MYCEMGCEVVIYGNKEREVQAVPFALADRQLVLCSDCQKALVAAWLDHPATKEAEKLASRKEVMLAQLTSASSGAAANLVEESARITDRLAALRREQFEFVNQWVVSTVRIKRK